MKDYQVAHYIKAMSYTAEVEAMKAANAQNERDNHDQRYTYEDFNAIAVALVEIVAELERDTIAAELERDTIVAELAEVGGKALKVDGRYNWIGQQERLIFLGCEGRWYQFAKVEEPKTVWCEVLPSDMKMLESTRQHNE